MSESSGGAFREWITGIEHDGLIRYRFAFNRERLLVASPKALAEVLVSKSYIFEKPDAVRDTLGRVLGYGIILVEGDEHKVQRRNLIPAFHFRHVKDLYPTFWSKGSYRSLYDSISTLGQYYKPCDRMQLSAGIK